MSDFSLDTSKKKEEKEIIVNYVSIAIPVVKISKPLKYAKSMERSFKATLTLLTSVPQC